MKPYKVIEDAQRVIYKLKNKIQYSKYKKQDVKDINTLIKALKTFDSMLVSKYKTDAVDTLLYSLFYKVLMDHKAYKDKIPIHEMMDIIMTDISYGAELKKKEVVSILKNHEMQNKIKNNTVFDKNYINFDKILDRTVLELKTRMKWMK